MQKFSFQVNGLPVEASFSLRDRDEIFIPLLERLTALQREKGRRICAFLAAPPAAGKSTLCLYLEKLSREIDGLTPVQSVGIDGFHYPNAYLETHFALRNGEKIPLSRVKGGPESYDVEKLHRMLRQLDAPGRWPVYDRRLHEPVEDALEIREKILILEGNWLLLEDEPWKNLPCDYAVFWAADDPMQLERVVQRKIMGGFAEAAARKFVMENDLPNIRYCMEHSRRGDMRFALNPSPETP